MMRVFGPKRVALEESQMADLVTRAIEPYATKVIRCLPQHKYCGVGVRRHESAGKGRRKASRQGNRYLKNAVMTAAATIANRRIADNALTMIWRAGIVAGVPGDRMKRNMARKDSD